MPRLPLGSFRLEALASLAVGNALLRPVFGASVRFHVRVKGVLGLAVDDSARIFARHLIAPLDRSRVRPLVTIKQATTGSPTT
jgi:hypothetical protein